MKSWVVCIAGARGSGKSLSAVALAVSHLRAGGRVFSNMTICLPDGRESEPLELADLATLSDEYQDALVVVDEIQNLVDSKRGMTVLNRLVGALVAQSRKRSLSFIYTVMNPAWVDNRVRYLTDVEIWCRDLSLTEWGREQGIGEGELIGWTIYDRSGALTGFQDNLVGRKVLRAKSFWGCYDTYQAQDVWEAFTRVKVKAPVMTIDLQEESAAEEKTAAPPPPVEGKVVEDLRYVYEQLHGATGINPALHRKLARAIRSLGGTR